MVAFEKQIQVVDDKLMAFLFIDSTPENTINVA